jgi:GMP synthase-like glutamine amidotransferase
MRILMIDHFEGSEAGIVGRALADAGAVIDRRAPYRGEPLPSDPDGFDALVSFGGPQNALDDAAFPYLRPLATLTARFGAANKAVLGICLGSQIIARGHGAVNILGRPIEFGWQPVRPTPEGRGDPMIAALGDGAPLFHWHSDTYTLPLGATRLAFSDQTETQAFRVGRAVYGIQFHFEADAEIVADWSEAHAATAEAAHPGWATVMPGLAATVGQDAERVGRLLADAFIARVFA